MKRCFSDEIASVLREELKGGRYKAGEMLPDVESLRHRFAAGDFAVRNAILKLRKEGLVTVKKHVGVAVTGKALHAWKGHVAFIHTARSCSYHPQMLAVQFAKRLESEGYALHAVFLDANTNERIDVSPLMRHIHNGLSFAIVLSESRKVTNTLDLAGVPYVVLEQFSRDYPNAYAVIGLTDMQECFAKLVQALKKRHVKNILEVDFERRMDRTFKTMLFAAGLNVRRELCRFDNEQAHTLADVRAVGYRAIARFLADKKRRANLPDVIMFDDDYLAYGGIMAILEAGLRIPEDIRVVAWMNRGNEICLSRTLACIQYDPSASADAIARYVLAVLAGRNPAPPRIKWRFVPGESL